MCFESVRCCCFLETWRFFAILTRPWRSSLCGRPNSSKDQNCQESNDYSHPYKPCSYGNVTFSGLLTSHLRRWSRSPFPCAHLSSLVMPLAATFQPRGARRQVAYHFKGHTVPWGAPEDILRCKLVTKVANMIYIIRSNGWKFAEPKFYWILRAYHWQDLLIFTAWVRSCFIFGSGSCNDLVKCLPATFHAWAKLSSIAAWYTSTNYIDYILSYFLLIAGSNFCWGFGRAKDFKTPSEFAFLLWTL